LPKKGETHVSEFRYFIHIILLALIQAYSPTYGAYPLESILESGTPQSNKKCFV